MQERAIGAQRLCRSDFEPTKDSFAAWLGGAGAYLHSRDNNVLIDPCFVLDAQGASETGLRPFFPPVLAAGEIGHLDAVLYTHSDADHMGLDSARALLPITDRFIVPVPCFETLIRAGFPAEKLTLCRPGQRFSVGEIALEVLDADHPWQLLDPERFGDPFFPGDCVGYSFTTPDGKLLVTGDTRLMPQHLHLRDEYSLVLLDISQDSYHLGLDGARVLAHHLSHARLLPCHYGTYDAPLAAPHNGSFCEAAQALTEDAPRLLRVKMGEKVVL